MKRKIQKHFIDYGTGFPVVLLNVPMVSLEGKWTPDINYNELEKAILIFLCHKPCKLTGNEVRFIRLYFEMTLKNFAKRFGVQHPTVVKWENFKNSATNMSIGTEKDLRLYIIAQLLNPRKIGDLYIELETNPFLLNVSENPIQLDVEKLAM